MGLIKIATAGSVDDGKSTLIGRLLYDTASIPADKLESIERISKQKGYDYLDFSLATDGLVAEREQGITIDVAHIYFSINDKSYIIADTPGHVEYTRNMVTGASTSEVAVVLIDARNGVTEQTMRHFFINDLLRTKHLIVAINKMDLVDFSETHFQAIKSDFEELRVKQSFQEQSISFIPISALYGDNVVHKSKRIPWYTGDSILDSFEHLKNNKSAQAAAARFQVQYVNRPKTEHFHDFRAYSGKVKSGIFKLGDKIKVLPSEQTSTIKEIFFYKENYAAASAGAAVSITLADDLQLGRGDMIVKADEAPSGTKNFKATICWMDKQAMNNGQKYIIQHGVHKVLGKINDIERHIRPNFSEAVASAQAVGMNDIAAVNIQLSKTMFFDPYHENSANGAFILIHPQSNNTVGVGFVNAV